ncbi:MAG: TonB-dependent receptor [Sphingobacteriales bacterium JAD_PAG50586_3]|nr:MAG: TonB-dependent receptor [Sphingobacteriales bacterium JAD_PAG50586_3]
MKFRILALVAAVLGLVSFSANAQTPSATGTVRGFIYDKKTGEPAPFVGVFLKGTTFGISSDINGLYSITNVPPGAYVLAAKGLDYDSTFVNITVKANSITAQNLYAEKKSVTLKGVDVVGDRQSDKTRPKISEISITPKEMNKIPTIGGQADLAQYMQVLPGVVSTGDQGGQLYIRGGSPVQNKTLLDGMIVYNPFHSIGFFSVFDADIIRNADVYTGGFGAEYGGRISSIMNITTRDGNKKNFSGKVSINPFTSKILLETPLKRQSEDGGSSSSFIFSAKSAYLNKTAPIFYTYADSAGLPFSFNDLYGKFSINGANGSKINLFGMYFSDGVDYASGSRLRWNTAGGGSNFVLVPSNSQVIFEGNFSYSQYKITLSENDQKPRSSAINSFNLGLGFKQFFKKSEIKYGLEVIGFATNFDFFNAVNRSIKQNDNTTEMAAYVKTRLVLGDRVVLEPSFRAHFYASVGALSPEPRLSAKVNITDWFRMKLAGGLYSQNLMAANSDRDVVNLFYGFLSSPTSLPDQFDGKDVKNGLQRSSHAILGFEFDAGKNIRINVEGYYIKFNQLTNINRNKIFDDIPENADQPDYLKKDFVIENGSSKGVDFTLKYEKGRLYVWLVYSLMYTNRYDGLMNYKPIFDRRHNVNAVVSYNFGKEQLWQADVRWNFGSGLPFTQTQGFLRNRRLTTA